MTNVNAQTRKPATDFEAEQYALNMCVCVCSRVKRGPLDQQVRMENKDWWGCSGRRALQDFQATTGIRLTLCVWVTTCECATAAALTGVCFPCCGQGEQGEAGQKGSKGDKGEGVSLDLGNTPLAPSCQSGGRIKDNILIRVFFSRCSQGPPGPTGLQGLVGQPGPLVRLRFVFFPPFRKLNSWTEA